MKNIMVDLETLGKGSNAVIVSIGAVQFDETGLGATFYRNVQPKSCVDVGMSIDVDTVMWWMKQGDDARKALTLPGDPLFKVLCDFSDYARHCGSLDEVTLWGNGATFDNVILGNAYDLSGLARPWAFWNDRCHRTLKNLYPGIQAPKPAVAHNALEDAKAQALHASRILAHIHGGHADDSVQPIPQGGTAHA